MSHEFQSGADALVMDERDHVATLLRDMEAGEIVHYYFNNELASITLVDSVPFGHKLAITAIEDGQDVRKYGEIIGRANQSIQAGCHVHVHNIEGIRGRGDNFVKETIA
ncbi:D-galactarate dehydratase [Paenibacillus baekrokdamisoli]|uniref:D-galactarate dehydratase n=1 Tax=Paenibacillus baekrokdamisoli TaxID=1712516 RepID=A0A3G9J6Y0_9BACL|nr:UxaA family hydrolase [Paenibacillus baekrokdamisoli]MBB3067273.1 altronate dehydratase small subunit [Paenibacillus baekrokdamisoli]BBH19538.1 D-galactarate dehydratase [Paenibacillus baekrokdamisoli]